MSDVSFVRTEMLPEQAPPASEVGPIGWIRHNLFSGWFNSILTLVSLYAIYYVLSGVLPWTFQSVWNADSLNQCREIMMAKWGSTHGHACWAVINDRWLQLLFGFYPSHLYWRPILALVLLLIALAPVLYSERVPTKLLILTAAYPFLLPFLMWGGTIWGPISAALGFVIGWGVYTVASKQISGLIGIILGVVASIIWWLVLSSYFVGAMDSILPIGIEAVQSRQFGGFMLAILLGVVAIGVSLPIGIVLALGRQSDLLIVKYLCVGFIEFIRGVPLITLLFVASLLLNLFLPPGTNFDIILRVMIMMTLFSAAYMAEVIRGGLAALPRGQYEGADSLGLNYWQAQRLIIMPQALKISIPGIVSTFIGIFKDTVLVSIIGLFDVIGLASAIRADTAWNGIYWELFAFIGALFFVVCFSMSRYSMYLERKLQTGHH
ncbi:L-glutamine ABC transporter membrane protein /L-glutamate ABC transporter membrane protein /L-aspartate ABC transporter membrane protein /L-asparagine ABC transporter membrane protein [Ruegeria halocynthiae]|uniref:L-glutamine ABC transporter membrane protein /L-glutamate ABC transporter membrane protein /L-aspartate ABC transporter membrane protein /L-asparagine ABC transporter membrane protein n=1 Tax=Ruegeria halocynthiae TaxID=985054 RepID=A0A1H2WK50_9RHOB|nr:amino acid ABC transporter permease [Ruegeria halocynthiae]SDW80644.1 L-glutamine ABC transporter membrane protein /L-glutamate ABC transporter membrane protein /L-aspartate ABC transporter membrane protein /L-asparagine ABC transporter membrane protein [Ruegeria halocynthiae]